MGRRKSQNEQGIFWMLTIPLADFSLPTELPPFLQWIRGQAEVGEGGYEHWQIVVAFKEKKRLRGVKSFFGRTCHGELTGSARANDYVFKEETRIADSGFEFGILPRLRNSKTDWEQVWLDARAGNLEAIPASIRVVSYRTVRQIGADFACPCPMERTARVYWGPTGTSKSRRAWEEAGMDAFSKDPRTKFWCGYQGQRNVVVDEFRGGIDIAHLLRWLDRYPVHVEIKGSSRPLLSNSYWFTSNLDPQFWYPEADLETREALMRRLTVEYIG